jgi:hypothetical protein
MAINHPHFGTFCEICFTQLTPDTCVVDHAGQKWDICPGECARAAGIIEAPPATSTTEAPPATSI